MKPITKQALERFIQGERKPVRSEFPREFTASNASKEELRTQARLVFRHWKAIARMTP